MLRARVQPTMLLTDAEGPGRSPWFRGWTPYKGRLQCFDELRREFDRVLSGQWTNQRNAVHKLRPNHLMTLLQQSALYQASAYLASASTASLPNPMFFDLLSPTFQPLSAEGKAKAPPGRPLAQGELLPSERIRKARRFMGVKMFLRE